MTDAIEFRAPRPEELETLVHLLVADSLGASRETLATPLPEAYARAFRAIADDPNNELIVAELEGRIVGLCQLTFIPGLTFEGGWRAQVEGVRVDASCRSAGVGRALMDEAVRRAKARDCRLVQLTTNKVRTDAHRFYERIGFDATHVGMKRFLDRKSG